MVVSNLQLSYNWHMSNDSANDNKKQAYLLGAIEVIDLRRDADTSQSLTYLNVYARIPLAADCSDFMPADLCVAPP
jgi:hypothetical protein